MAGFRRVTERIYDENGNKFYTVEAKCPMCDNMSHRRILDSEYFAYTHNMPNKLSADDREFLMTGMCQECQDDIFGEPEDWEEDDWEDDEDE